MSLIEDTKPKVERNISGDSPPEYSLASDQQPVIPPLSLSQNAGPELYTTVTHYECIAHLKFLAALSDLRDTVTSQSNLFDIPDPSQAVFGEHINEAWALVKEKRWAVYTAKAVDRYTAWWNACVPQSRSRPTTETLYTPEYNDITVCDRPLAWTPAELPPLDVLMVWHAHMLNPRSFLEDCIRHGKMSFWSTGFPWETINACINDQTLLYDAGGTAVTTFTWKTSLNWDNMADMPTKTLTCPNCAKTLSAPWTKGGLTLPLDQTFDHWTGFTDKNFGIYCDKCNLRITHDTLRIQKLTTDVDALLDNHLPMPGTLLSAQGIPERQHFGRRRQQQPDLPNRLLTAGKREIHEYIRASLWTPASLIIVRDRLASLMQNKEIMRETNMLGLSMSLLKDEKIAFRRMMSRYWENSSPFALDLVGAVVRQGTFVQKMDNIDWLHSPTLTETTLRLIRKYAVFFQIMASNPTHMAVPTLDVDLAWHTHQLTPSRYFAYSIHRTRSEGYSAIYIDHDDKVSEVKLSDGFEWTSRQYRKVTDGGIYSECTCWYCEATRGSDLHGNILPFTSSSNSKARANAADLHENPEISSDPDRNPHISAHSAVRVKYPKGVNANEVKYLKLRTEWDRCRRREEKRNSKTLVGSLSKSKDGKDDKEKEKNKDGTDPYAAGAYPLMWGYPVFVPYYAPYVGDPGVHCDAYAADPSCMNLQPGAAGNCASGTCGGAVAAGACGGRGGGCAGGCAGGCGGGGGGCGGGGGGGGCGGGGGGC
ncbi:hypothetical protein BDW69DRAFT_201032 [Aspergillus filifer]